MTKQDKELLLKDLSARMPYGVFVETKSEFLPREVVSIGYKIQKDCVTIRLDCVDEEPIYEICSIENVKPYLRPMSSMTEEEKMHVNELIYDKDGLFLSPIPTWVINECDIDKYIDFCNSKHLDWRGLIEKGLALPAPEGMYNK